MIEVSKDVSPMMRQYLEIKKEHKDSIVFFRLGDFYEMFFEDANLVSEELGLTLTGKDYGQKERAPMCGVPYHSCESYIARLVARGYKIAMCDQIGDPAKAKGLVERKVVRVITPGTVMEESMLDEAKNNFICSVYCSGALPIAGIAFCDTSTGELKVTEIFGNDKELANQLKIEIGKFCPSEIICFLKQDIYSEVRKFVNEKLQCNVEILKEDITDQDAQNSVKSHFQCNDLKNLSLANRVCAVKSIANLLSYLKKTQKGDLHHINFPVFYDKSQYMGLDLNTIRNLELLETIRTKSKKGSLLWVIDKTRTSMGKRMLRSWIERPLLDTEKILVRQGAVEELFKDTIFRENLKKKLGEITDIQRLTTKIAYASANAKDLRSLSEAISKLPSIKALLENSKSKMLKKMYFKFDTLSEVRDLIEASVHEKPPITIKDGGIIKDGYSPEVDRLRSDIKGGTAMIHDMEEKERKRLGIPKLKITYNKVFGYFIEVTNSFKDKVPSDYIRRQTLTGCERYVTEELKNLESRIMYAKESINETEYKIFEEVRNKVAESFSKIIAVANIIAALDAVRSLAEVAVYNNYVKPEINTLDTISIKEGRHPVVEALVAGNTFVPNDLILDSGENNVAIITGPNMAGKSTYMRQAALIVLLAQIGAYVPASSAKIGIVDNIFTRIGASDDLAAGQSTFMVEMSEVAEILKNSTSKSLLILDEIGRGTSTFDGMSIARAVLEYVADKRKLGAKTLFATHYHELTEISKEFHNVKNYSVAVENQGEGITFLHTIVEGAVDDSYGIEVAKLAGLPASVISRAREVLRQIEDSEGTMAQSMTCFAQNESKEAMDPNISEILMQLGDININNLNPIESMNILYKLVGLAQNIRN